MAAPLPLSTLLSQVLVAFTIEFDNEFEHRMPHRITNATSPANRGPWLVSMAMWSNFMRLVPDEGITVDDLRLGTRVKEPSLAGMERWGYVDVAPDSADRRPKPPRGAWLIRPTARGREARELWRPLARSIEARWIERFGARDVDELRSTLSAVNDRLDVNLPEYLPVVGYGLFAPTTAGAPRVLSRDRREVSSEELPALLSKLLLAFALEFEHDSSLSLASCANVLRVLDEPGVRIRDLPMLSGTSKEGIHVALGVLAKGGYVVTEADPTASRTKLVRLTGKGRDARRAYVARLDGIEKGWQARYGRDVIAALRGSLEAFVGSGALKDSPLRRGLEPYPDGWRAAVRAPETLPHYPMVLHRGGYPDGS